MHRGPLSLASYEWAHRGRWDPVEIVQWYHLALRAWGAFFFCPKLVPATPNLMAVSRRAWIVPLPSTFSNSAGGAYGHTAGNRRTWQTQKAGSGVNKILCRMMYLLIYFFSSKNKSIEVYFMQSTILCFTTTIFFGRGFFLHGFFNVLVGPSLLPPITRWCRALAAPHVPVWRVRGAQRKQQPNASGVDGWGDVLWWGWYKVGPGKPVTFKGQPWLQENSHWFSAIERGFTAYKL